jgi:hypothetical protein
MERPARILIVTFALTLLRLVSFCADSGLPAIPPVITIGGKTYLSELVAVDALKPGEFVLIRSGDGFQYATVGSSRGRGVFRLVGAENRFISADNFCSRLVLLDAFVKAASEKRAAIQSATPEQIAAGSQPEEPPTPQPSKIAESAQAQPPQPISVVVSEPKKKEQVAAAIRPLDTGPKAEVRPVAQTSEPNTSFVEDVATLARLHSRGILSEKEFQAASKRMEDLIKLSDLHSRGILSDDQFQSGKKRILMRAD